MRITRRAIPLLALFGLLVAAGCESSTEPPPAGPTPAEIEVIPTQITFTAIGQSEAIEATVLDEEGHEIEDAEITWSSSDEAVATVNDAGVVEAAGEGSATITAESGEVSATLEVIVELEG